MERIFAWKPWTKVWNGSTTRVFDSTVNREQKKVGVMFTSCPGSARVLLLSVYGYIPLEFWPFQMCNRPWITNLDREIYVTRRRVKTAALPPRVARPVENARHNVYIYIYIYILHVYRTPIPFKSPIRPSFQNLNSGCHFFLFLLLFLTTCCNKVTVAPLYIY